MMGLIMKKPEDSTVTCAMGVVDTDEVASEAISMLDERFSRADVKKIAEWIYYLSTQE